MAQRPPSMVTYGRIDHIIEKIKNARTPDRFTNDFLKEVIEAKGSNDRAFISLAKRCGLLNPDGSPSDSYKRLRSTNEATSNSAMAEAIKVGYSDIYALNEYAHKLSAKDFEGLVLQLTGLEKGNASVANIVKTFQALKKHANFEIESHTDGAGTESGDSVADVAGNENTIPPAGGNERPPLNLGLSYQINIVLPKTDDIAVFNAIFKSLKDNLLEK